jgi:hypothetical protein
MSVRTACILAAVVLAAAGCGGGDGSPTAPAFGTFPVQGRVTDATSGAAITGASVTIGRDGATVTAISNAVGQYTLHVPQGQAQLEATASGYAKVTMPVNVPTTGLVVDIRLSRAP